MPLFPKYQGQNGKLLAITICTLLLIIVLGNPLLGTPGRAALANSSHADSGQAEGFDSQVLSSQEPLSVNVAQHWASLLCRFSDVSAEPQSGPFFDDMFERTSGPSLSDYWQEVSYGHIPSVTTDVHGWFTLPFDRAHYNFSDSAAGYEVTNIVQDCVDAADASVSFAPYDAVAVFLNSPSPVAITTLFPVNYPDSAQINLGAITIPSNKYNLALVAHEMGHAFGLPHSFANGVAYQNPWDLMGIASGYRCSENADPVYSCLGQHTIAQYKDRLGWIAPEQKFAAPQGESTITLERLAEPQTTNYLMATIATASDTYVVEARQRVGYDAKLAADAVIIHRGSGDDLVDSDGAPFDDDSATWLPGESYHDQANGVTISVDAATATGYVITINNENAPPQLMRVQLFESPSSPRTNDQVDFTAQIFYEGADFGNATNLVVTVTLPVELTYVPGSAVANGGSVVNENPIVAYADSLFTFFPLNLDYSATVNAGVAGPTWIQVPVEVRWDGGSLSAAHVFLANGRSTYLPLLVK